MSQFTVELFEETNGESPVEDFLRGLDIKMRAKLVGLLQILQEKGNLLRERSIKSISVLIYADRSNYENIK